LIQPTFHTGDINFHLLAPKIVRRKGPDLPSLYCAVELTISLGVRIQAKLPRDADLATRGLSVLQDPGC
jgi:hypothetical protein